MEGQKKSKNNHLTGGDKEGVGSTRASIQSIRNSGGGSGNSCSGSKSNSRKSNSTRTICSGSNILLLAVAIL